MEIKHGDLVFAAKKHLLKTIRCNPVYTEQGTGWDGERPDVIGWKRVRALPRGKEWEVLSFVVECKSSRQDFRVDHKKEHRTNGCGMGSFRYFLVPEELNDVECPQGWGLLIARTGLYEILIKKSRESDRFESNVQREVSFLRSRILEIQRFGRH